jgi:predicted glycoside hydrolase/deacetylase ChbG (UPF0249 family)
MRALLFGACMTMLAAMAASAQSSVDTGPSLAERLGYSATDKLLIIHADDVGMCHSVNVASFDAMEHGVVTCGSIMMPCPWVLEAAAYMHAHPDADLGLHLTLTSEWGVYRWRPITPQDQAAGLIDEQGYMWHEVENVLRHASSDEVEKEVKAQIERAEMYGMKATHVDSHMGTLFMGKYVGAYTRQAKAHNLICMMPKPTRQMIALGKVMGNDVQKIFAELAPQGYVFLDELVQRVDGRTLEQRKKAYYDVFRGLKPGVTELIVHLGGNDEEARHIMGSWENRYNDYLIMKDPETKALIDQLGIKLIGYRPLIRLAYKTH